MSSIGIDIEEVKRFQGLVKSKRFLYRVYSQREIAYCRAKKNKLQHFAVRFAAKEAVWKALSETFFKKSHITHKDIAIRNEDSGKPTVVFPLRYRALEKKIMISLSHTQSYVVAVALLKD